MNKTLYLNSSFESKAFKKGTKSLKIAGYANTTVKDRAGDVVTAEAWAKGVENFRRNPVLLYQHKHDCPIGKVEKIQVDKKGLYVEGMISEAAEKTHGVQTLVKDGALKSFSVGFRVKDGKYNREDDSMYITDVELLEKYKNIRSEPLDCPISVLGGKSDPAISKAMLAGWQTLTRSVFVQHEFPGEHFFINSERNLVIETILNDLARKD